MHEEAIYLIFSILTASLAVVGAIFALHAMRRGLQYSVMNAIGITLIILALAGIWHTFREIKGLDEEWSEFIEYGLRSFAYVYFIFIEIKALRVKDPHSK